MPIFRKNSKSIFFFHVPKAGGTTVELVFKDNGYRVILLDPGGKGSLNSLRYCSPQHMHTDQVSKLFNLNKFDTSFMLARNPYDRVRSEFCMRHQSAHCLSKNERVVAFKNWLRYVFKNYPQNPFMLDNHIRPQAEFCAPQTTVFRLEEGLETVFSSLSEALGDDILYDGRSAYTRNKISGFSSLDVGIDEECRELIYDFYSVDFKLFGYEF